MWTCVYYLLFKPHANDSYVHLGGGATTRGEGGTNI